MFDKLKIKPAKKHDAKHITKLFSSINASHKEQAISQMIEDKRVYVLKKKKKIKAAFAFSVLGILGLCSFLYIRKIAVDSEFQGKGVGSFLLSKIKRFSHKKGGNGFFLYSLKKVESFYKKNKLQNLWRFFWWK